MNWDDLKIMLAVARSGSLTRAAVVLGMDQSTVSRRLTAIEADLGSTLFVRSKTGIAPTELGERVMTHAADIERRVDRLVEDATATESAVVGTLRVLSNAWILNRLIDEGLRSFLDAHPKLRLRLLTNPPEVRMRGDATISLWFERAPEHGEFAIKLGDVPFDVFAPKGIDPDTLDWVSFFDEDAPRRAPVRNWEKIRKSGDVLRLTATDASLLQTSVQRGVGKGILPLCLAVDDPALERIETDRGRFLRTLHLHAHPDTVQSLRVQKTIRWLRDNFERIFLPQIEN